MMHAPNRIMMYKSFVFVGLLIGCNVYASDDANLKGPETGSDHSIDVSKINANSSDPSTANSFAAVPESFSEDVSDEGKHRRVDILGQENNLQNRLQQQYEEKLQEKKLELEKIQKEFEETKKELEEKNVQILQCQEEQQSHFEKQKQELEKEFNERRQKEEIEYNQKVQDLFKKHSAEQQQLQQETQKRNVIFEEEKQTFENNKQRFDRENEQLLAHYEQEQERLQKNYEKSRDLVVEAHEMATYAVQTIEGGKTKYVSFVQRLSNLEKSLPVKLANKQRESEERILDALKQQQPNSAKINMHVLLNHILGLHTQYKWKVNTEGENTYIDPELSCYAFFSMHTAKWAMGGAALGAGAAGTGVLAAVGYYPTLKEELSVAAIPVTAAGGAFGCLAGIILSRFQTYPKSIVVPRQVSVEGEAFSGCLPQVGFKELNKEAVRILENKRDAEKMKKAGSY